MSWLNSSPMWTGGTWLRRVTSDITKVLIFKIIGSVETLTLTLIDL